VATVKTAFERIRHAVRTIPEGRVSTYGAVADRAGMPGQARIVGWALAGLDHESDVPWHRVINSRGGISVRGAGGHLVQRALLEAEGVRFDAGGVVDLDRYGW